MTSPSDPALKEVQRALEVATSTKADPEVIEALKRALNYVDMRNDYCMKCTSPPSAICRQISESTVSHPWSDLKGSGEESHGRHHYTPRMVSGHLEGQFLKSLVSAQRASSALDVGMFTGYSALSLAEALPPQGRVVTLDRDPYLRDLNLPVFKSSPHGHKITIKLGDALDSMRELLAEGQKFDFIFLDAEKSKYIDYLKVAFEEGLLAENGTVAVDNLFLGGRNYLPSDPQPVSALFGEHVTQDKSLHKVLVPIRDGVMLIRRQSEVERENLTGFPS